MYVYIYIYIYIYIQMKSQGERTRNTLIDKFCKKNHAAKNWIT